MQPEEVVFPRFTYELLVQGDGHYFTIRQCRSSSRTPEGSLDCRRSFHYIVDNGKNSSEDCGFIETNLLRVHRTLLFVFSRTKIAYQVLIKKHRQKASVFLCFGGIAN